MVNKKATPPKAVLLFLYLHSRMQVEEANMAIENLSLIVAFDENRAIGYQNDLPWPRIPGDMRRFKELTEHHAVIMGRNTYGSILAGLGKPLPNRRNIVISRTYLHDGQDIELVRTLGDALQLVEQDTEPFIIGGARLYRDAFPYVTRMYVTRVLGEHDADTYFPEYNQDEWDEIPSSFDEIDFFVGKDEERALKASFFVYERRSNP